MAISTKFEDGLQVMRGVIQQLERMEHIGALEETDVFRAKLAEMEAARAKQTQATVGKAGIATENWRFVWRTHDEAVDVFKTRNPSLRLDPVAGDLRIIDDETQLNVVMLYERGNHMIVRFERGPAFPMTSLFDFSAEIQKMRGNQPHLAVWDAGLVNGNWVVVVSDDFAEGYQGSRIPSIGRDKSGREQFVEIISASEALSRREELKDVFKFEKTKPADPASLWQEVVDFILAQPWEIMSSSSDKKTFRAKLTTVKAQATGPESEILKVPFATEINLTDFKRFRGENGLELLYRFIEDTKSKLAYGSAKQRLLQKRDELNARVTLWEKTSGFEDLAEFLRSSFGDLFETVAFTFGAQWRKNDPIAWSRNDSDSRKIEMIYLSKDLRDAVSILKALIIRWKQDECPGQDDDVIVKLQAKLAEMSAERAKQAQAAVGEVAPLNPVQLMEKAIHYIVGDGEKEWEDIGKNVWKAKKDGNVIRVEGPDGKERFAISLAGESPNPDQFFDASALIAKFRSLLSVSRFDSPKVMTDLDAAKTLLIESTETWRKHKGMDELQEFLNKALGSWGLRFVQFSAGRKVGFPGSIVNLEEILISNQIEDPIEAFQIIIDALQTRFSESTISILKSKLAEMSAEALQAKISTLTFERLRKERSETIVVLQIDRQQLLDIEQREGANSPKIPHLRDEIDKLEKELKALDEEIKRRAEQARKEREAGPIGVWSDGGNDPLDSPLGSANSGEETPPATKSELRQLREADFVKREASSELRDTRYASRDTRESRTPPRIPETKSQKFETEFRNLGGALVPEDVKNRLSALVAAAKQNQNGILLAPDARKALQKVFGVEPAQKQNGAVGLGISNLVLTDPNNPDLMAAILPMLVQLTDQIPIAILTPDGIGTHLIQETNVGLSENRRLIVAKNWHEARSELRKRGAAHVRAIISDSERGTESLLLSRYRVDEVWAVKPGSAQAFFNVMKISADFIESFRSALRIAYAA